jgi:signal peptidase I
MEPTYSDGDWVRLEPVAGSRLIRLGEVVVARRGDRLVSHRVVSLRGGLVVTKGDACLHPDPPISIGGLIGRVSSVRRGSGLSSMLRRALRRVRSFSRPPYWREQ